MNCYDRDSSLPSSDRFLLPRRFMRYSVFDEAYGVAYQRFIGHTDQVLRRIAQAQGHAVERGMRGLFVDIGCGSGEITAGIAGSFQAAIAFEPNRLLAHHAQKALRGHRNARVIAGGITLAGSVLKPRSADLVLCSHVLYYLSEELWLPAVKMMVDWLAPGGRLLVVLADPRSDEMRICDQFYGAEFSLEGLATQLSLKHRERFRVALSTDFTHLDVPNSSVGFDIAEFLLNPVYKGVTPSSSAVRRFVQDSFLAAPRPAMLICKEQLMVVERMY